MYDANTYNTAGVYSHQETKKISFRTVYLTHCGHIQHTKRHVKRYFKRCRHDVRIPLWRGLGLPVMCLFLKKSNTRALSETKELLLSNIIGNMLIQKKSYSTPILFFPYT